MPSKKNVSETDRTANTKTEANDPTPKQAPAKKQVFYFKNRKYAGLTMQVQKTVDDPVTHQKVQEVDEQATFEQFYDTWKGDVVRVGFLKTDSVAIAERCRADSSCEEIDEKEYNQAVKGDEKNKPLQKAPSPVA